MSDTPEPHDAQTAQGAVWGDEFVDSGDTAVENEPGDQSPPASPQPFADGDQEHPPSPS
jgi:hypothetical protein